MENDMKKGLAFFNFSLWLIIIGTSLRCLADGHYLLGAACLFVVILRGGSVLRHVFIGVDEEQEEVGDEAADVVKERTPQT